MKELVSLEMQLKKQYQYFLKQEKDNQEIIEGLTANDGVWFLKSIEDVGVGSENNK